MEDYYKNFEFKIKNPIKLSDKLKRYFETYNYEQIKDKNNHMLFVKKFSILNGWKINPLNWEAKIDIKLIENNRILIKHRVVGNGHFTPIAFTDLFENFLSNLEGFINQDKAFTENNSQQVKLAKKKFLKYFGLLVVGVLLGLCCGKILANITGYSLISQLGIIIGGLMTLKILNQNIIKNTTLKHGV